VVHGSFERPDDLVQQSVQPSDGYTRLLVLLGPQRFRPTLREAVRALGIDGAVAVVTAGWQEREGEDTEMQKHLHQEVLDLGLYRRAEDVLQRDRELAAALRTRQETLRQLQELYRLRLSYALEATRELSEASGASTTSSPSVGSRPRGPRWPGNATSYGESWSEPPCCASPAVTSPCCSAACACST
jgi:hypothetical protein